MMMQRHFLQFKNWKTGEAEAPIDVTGRAGREIERIEIGMLSRCDFERGWGVDEFKIDA